MHSTCRKVKIVSITQVLSKTYYRKQPNEKGKERWGVGGGARQEEGEAESERKTYTTLGGLLA